MLVRGGIVAVFSMWNLPPSRHHAQIEPSRFVVSTTTPAAPAAFGVTQPSSDLRRQQHDTIITSIMPSRISGLSSSPLDFNP
jgi:hypothetical protein